MSVPRLSRRSFLASLFLAAAARVPVWGGGPKRLLANRLGQCFRREDAEAIARAYRALHPDGGPVSPDLAAALGGWPRVAFLDTVSLRRSLQAAVREDFSAGRVEILRGWPISRTEINACLVLHEETAARAG